MNVLEQLSQLKGKLSSVRQILSSGSIESWEAKEYAQLAKSYEEEVVALTNYIQENKEYFNA